MAVENPALNQDAFARGIAQAPATEQVGMTVAGTYLITAGLLVLLVVAGAFGWSQVVIRNVGGEEVAIAPRWVWITFFLVFILAMVGAFAFEAYKNRGEFTSGNTLIIAVGFAVSTTFGSWSQV